MNGSLSKLVTQHAPHAKDFAALTEACEGAWPGAVRRMLQENDSVEARRLLASVGTPRDRVTSDRRLPMAHPLDADWRFTRETADRILDTILAMTDCGSDILLIAMPSVALAAWDRGVAQRIVVASRENDPIDAALRKAMKGGRFVNLRTVAEHQFQTVALDPPWYDDTAIPLVELALRAATRDGRILLGIPDNMTSPSDARRLSGVARVPGALGFSQAELVERVRYTTPFFELRSLQALGIANVSANWRTGLLYSCTPARVSPTTFTDGVAPCTPWRETRHGQVRIWFRDSASLGGEQDVGVANSVSRRDPMRGVAGIWTSGNTYVSNAGVVGPEVIQAALDGLGPFSWQRNLQTALSQEVSSLAQAVDFT